MKIKTIEIAGFKGAIKGMRNPLSSWDKSDSKTVMVANEDGYYPQFVLGENDIKLAQTLITAGTEHCKFLRFICVWADMNMPRYWWSEADTYKFIEKNSTSTMHKLLNNKNPITLEMFAYFEEDKEFLEIEIQMLNKMREEFLNTKDPKVQNKLLTRAKRILSEGYLQLRTVYTNYAELRSMYFQRQNHRLEEEWVDTFCKWVEGLPYAKQLITYKGAIEK